MGVTEKTAILVISFGTSYEETRKKTIEQIESDLHHAFPEYPLYCAWTSPRIRAKLRKRDGIHIMDIDEAMTQLKADGIRNVVVQPTYVITGFAGLDEYHQSFVDARTPAVKDVGIDSIGAFIGILLVQAFCWSVLNNPNKKKKKRSH